MLGVTITDRKEDNFLAVDLLDILHLLGTLTIPNGKSLKSSVLALPQTRCTA